MNKSEWIWMPHPAHFIAADSCQFVLATYLPSGYIVSTVGEYRPSYKPENAAYEKLNFDWLYETMVFKAMPADAEQCDVCPYRIDVSNDVAMEGYNDAKAAYDGHMALCEEWSNT